VLSETSAEQNRKSSVSDVAEPRLVRRQLSKVERHLLEKIDPGGIALIISAVVLVLMACLLLPWVGSTSGWQVLTGEFSRALNITILPRLFSIDSTIAGIVFSALALTTRRWAIAWVAAMSSVLVSLEGLVAIWSRDTVAQAGPSVGLYLADLCMFVLTALWLRVVWTRN
jgi:hypothetical protein